MIWSWQSHTLPDFVTAITLSLNELTETEIISQSPIVWQDENQEGRWFAPNPKLPFITFWLKETKKLLKYFKTSTGNLL